MVMTRILVVDDEPLCLQPITKILMRQGYEVFSATGGQQALDIIRTAPSIDLVLSDIAMPEMRGTTLVREVTRISPHTATLLMSGFHHDTADLPDDVPLLEKPFSTQELIFAILAARDKSVQLKAKVDPTPSAAQEYPTDINNAAKLYAELNEARC
jgi:DNA-binding NtrC family response regulator